MVANEDETEVHFCHVFQMVSYALTLRVKSCENHTNSITVQNVINRFISVLCQNITKSNKITENLRNHYFSRWTVLFKEELDWFHHTFLVKNLLQIEAQLSLNVYPTRTHHLMHLWKRYPGFAFWMRFLLLSYLPLHAYSRTTDPVYSDTFINTVCGLPDWNVYYRKSNVNKI